MLNQVLEELGPADLDYEGKVLFSRYRKPCVYIWVRGNTLVYIGFSRRGFQRCFADTHQVMSYFTEKDRLLVYLFNTPELAYAKEQELISKYKTLMNKDITTKRYNDVIRKEIKVCVKCGKIEQELKELKKRIKDLEHKKK